MSSIRRTGECIGNSFTKAVLNSNIIPYYIDFFSTTLPSGFYLGGFTANGFLISSTFDNFNLQITADSKYPKLPAQIIVNASTALPGDQLTYKFHY